MNACTEYGTAIPLRSSTAVLQFRNDGGVSYASDMDKPPKNAAPKAVPHAPFGFGMRLQAARKAANLTQLQLGVGAGEYGKDAGKQSISDWEKERYYPKVDQLRVMCLRLNISADELVFGDLKRAAAMAQAESAVQQLTPEQRRALLAKMLGPAVSDHGVEQKMPITRAPPASQPPTTKSRKARNEE